MSLIICSFAGSSGEHTFVDIPRTRRNPYTISIEVTTADRDTAILLRPIQLGKKLPYINTFSRPKKEQSCSNSSSVTNLWHDHCFRWKELVLYDYACLTMYFFFTCS